MMNLIGHALTGRTRRTGRWAAMVLLSTGLVQTADAELFRQSQLRTDALLIWEDPQDNRPAMVPSSATPSPGSPSPASPSDSAAVQSPNIPAPAGQPQSVARPSFGQQPFPTVSDVSETPSQTNTNQLNQLFQIPTTPNICAAGEGYATANFVFVKYPGTNKQYRYQVQGQYGITDQIAAGLAIPVLSTRTRGTDVGLGDIRAYGQYKLDRIINPEIIDVTAQLDVIFPSGDRTALRDTGKFGVRPSILAYKDLGMRGPGDLGLYGSFGFTLTTNSDVRFGLAGTYQINDLVGVLEVYDQAGDRQGRPLLQITPGFVYRGLGPWEVGVGVPVGINKGTPDWSLNFKLTYVFEK